MDIQAIGTIHSPFKQKLGIPRQPLLCPSVKGKIILESTYAREDTLRELETFSHLWLLYWCHKSDSWRETIKPPRLGGKKKVGFFATRSPHRPNPIGLSLVKLDKINEDFSLEISGLDILDGTPLIDIKPYLPMWDAIDSANNGWVDKTPGLKPIGVDFSKLKEEDLKVLMPEEKQVLEETLCWDPRPAYTKDEERTFIHQIGNIEVTWMKEADAISVLKIKRH